MGNEDYVNLTSVDGKVMEEYVPHTAIVPTAAVVTKMISVIAPTDLAPGYQFEAEANGERYKVTVPNGGVKKGQQMLVPAELMEDHRTTSNSLSTKQATVGAWKDGLFSCLRYGCCHAHLCLSCWCAPIALAQVMTRTRLSWCAEPGTVQQVAATFRTVLWLVILYFVTNQVLSYLFTYLYPEYGKMEYQDMESAVALAQNAPIGAIILEGVMQGLQMLFGIYILITTCRTRMRVREQYQIPERSCRGCEDLCCALWCQCCTTMQMLRHTADYDTQPASCCTETGLPSWVQTV